MWVKNDAGQLLNLTHARLIQIFPAHDEYMVVAEFMDESDAEFVELKRGLSEAHARELLERIARALDGNDRFLDLTRFA